MDNGLYDKCNREFNEKQKLLENERNEATKKWNLLQLEAINNGFDITTM